MERGSYLGTKISRLGNVLKKTTASRINDYKKRLSRADACYEPLLKNLIVDDFSKLDASETAKKFFNTDQIKFVAIDGTEYSNPLFDMIVFYAGAYTCEGTIRFSPDEIKVEYKNKSLQLGKDLSSCVPLHMDKIPEIDQTTVNSSSQEVGAAAKPMTEEQILDNTNISNALMTLSEFYLAYRCATLKDYNFILLDRSLSNTYSSLMYDTSIWNLQGKSSSLIGFEVDGVLIDVNDLIISRQALVNEELGLPPNRGDYVRYAILNQLRHHRDGLNITTICSNLKLTNNLKIISHVQKYIETWVKEGVVVEENKNYRLNPRYETTWTRMKNLVNILGDQIFRGQEDPFILKKADNSEDWITTGDLAYLTLLCLYMLIEECWKNKIILVGITKDTSAHDFKNHIIPVCLSNDIWSTTDLNLNMLTLVPNSDRMFLQSVSVSNYSKIIVPWSLIEYDSAFVTVVPDFSRRKGYVSGAIQNKIIPSRVFLRSFVQLQQAKGNPMFRSNVLAVDRLAFSNYDLSPENLVEFNHEYFGHEKVSFILYKNNKTHNRIQNLIMCTLSSMTAPSIGEAFGHNKPLYIADKVAKWHNEEFRKIVDSTGAIILCDKGLRNFVFYMNSFREKRREFETNR
ncbi:MAG: hypothetical protein ACRD97_08270 [Nitrososphaeraceae archaeon]